MPWFLLLCLMTCAVIGAEESPAWVWTQEEQAKLDKAEKHVKQVKGWYKVESANWIVETQVDARFTAEWALFMERFNSAMHSIVGFGTQDAKNVAEKPLVKIFSTQKEYIETHDPESRGVFSCSKGKNGVVSNLVLASFVAEPTETRLEGFPIQVMQHEGTHLLVRRTFGTRDVPAWFNEGLASFFESWDFRKTKEWNLKDKLTRSRYAPFVRDMLDHKTLPTVETFFKEVCGKGWKNADEETVWRNYCIAESLMDTMARSADARSAFRGLSDRILKETDEAKLMSPAECATFQSIWEKHLALELPAAARRKSPPGL